MSNCNAGLAIGRRGGIVKKADDNENRCKKMSISFESIKGCVITIIFFLFFLYWVFLPKLNPQKRRNLKMNGDIPVSTFTYTCVTIELLIFLCAIICHWLSTSSSIIETLIWTWLIVFSISMINILWTYLRRE